MKIPQKTVLHAPAEKLYDAFVAILAGAHGLSELNTKHGRQLGRVVSGATQEVAADLLFAGNVQLNSALRTLVTVAEDVLNLDRWRRSRSATSRTEASTIMSGATLAGRPPPIGHNCVLLFNLLVG